jgi:hypothetical protein
VAGLVAGLVAWWQALGCAAGRMGVQKPACPLRLGVAGSNGAWPSLPNAGGRAGRGANAWPGLVRLVATRCPCMGTTPHVPQAQQYDWLRQDYPGLFARIKACATEGRFLPVRPAGWVGAGVWGCWGWSCWGWGWELLGWGWDIKSTH